MLQFRRVILTQVGINVLKPLLGRLGRVQRFWNRKRAKKLDLGSDLFERLGAESIPVQECKIGGCRCSPSP